LGYKWYKWWSIVITLLNFVFVPSSALQAAPVGDLIVGISLAPEVFAGASQSYNILLRPANDPISNVYAIVYLHPDSQVTTVDDQMIGINHTEGIQCAVIQDYTLAIFCTTDLLATDQKIGIHTTIVGPADDGRYAVLRVGTATDGSPNRGWVLEADYVMGGTIPGPTSLEPASEPTKYTIYLDSVRTK
jgi:hypothetical protein